MNDSIVGKSGTPGSIKSFKIPEMYNCLTLEDITFSFDKSYFRYAKAFTISEDIGKMKKSSPSDARIFIYGHTDNVGTPEYNKKLSDRRAKAIFAFLTHDYNYWLQLHKLEGWGIAEVKETIFALNQEGPNQSSPKITLPIECYIGKNRKKIIERNLLRLYKDYMEHCVNRSLNSVADFCQPKSFAGCSEFNPIVPASTSRNIAVRNDENERNRRVVIFLVKNTAAFPCKTDTMKYCELLKYKPPAKSSHLFQCEFYDKFIMNGKCPLELKTTKKPAPVPSEKTNEKKVIVTLGFPASNVEDWILKKYKTQPELFAKMLEVLEVNNSGKVVAVLPEEIESVNDENRLVGKTYIFEEPYCLVKTSVYYRNSEFYYKAEVVIRESGEKLFEEVVHAPRLIGVEGYWQKSGKYIWRYVQKGEKAKPGYETEYRQGLGIDNYRNDLHFMLSTERKERWKEYGNITERVKAIMKERGYKVM